MSLALQSFNKTNPNIFYSASFTFIGYPKLFVFPPKKAPISNSKSSLLHSEKIGSWVFGSFYTYPLGLRISVPEITTLDDLP
jgi:hypothetical protein